MRTRILAGLALLSVSVLTVCGCAGAGKGVTAQPAAPTTAVVTLSTQGALPSGTVIGGIDVTLNLPPGVTAKADKSGATAAGVVVASGGAEGAPLVAKYTPTAGTAPGQVRMVVVKPVGFATGEFATMNLDISGAPPRVNDFSTTALRVTDVNGVSITNLTATLALQVK
jgi:hypothetical protein